MTPLKIKAEWDDEASVWVATSQDMDGLAIEADTMDILIDRLKIVIPELMEANHKEPLNDDFPFMLDGFLAHRTTSNHIC